MTFAHDTDVALQTAAALVNTAVGAFPDDSGDTLETVEQLRDFYVGWAWTGRFDGGLGGDVRGGAHQGHPFASASWSRFHGSDLSAGGAPRVRSPL